jgi:hypothetical protein
LQRHQDRRIVQGGFFALRGKPPFEPNHYREKEMEHGIITTPIGETIATDGDTNHAIRKNEGGNLELVIVEEDQPEGRVPQP